MPSPEASRRNLAKVERPRWYTESQIIKRLIWRWAMLSRKKRQPMTQRAWARTLGVTQQYVSKVERRWVVEGMDTLISAGSRETLDDLHEAIERRLRFSLLGN